MSEESSGVFGQAATGTIVGGHHKRALGAHNVGRGG